MTTINGGGFLLLPKVHIDALVQAGIQWRIPDGHSGYHDALGRELWMANRISVYHVTGADWDGVPVYHFQGAGHLALAPWPILYAARCWEIQSDAVPGWDQRPGAQYIAELAATIAVELGIEPGAWPLLLQADAIIRGCWPVEDWAAVAAVTEQMMESGAHDKRPGKHHRCGSRRARATARDGRGGDAATDETG